MAGQLLMPVERRNDALRSQNEDSDDDVIEIIDDRTAQANQIEVIDDHIIQADQTDTFFVCFWCDCQFSAEELCRQHIETCHSPANDGVQELASHEEPALQSSVVIGAQGLTEIISIQEQPKTVLLTVEDDDDDVIICSSSKVSAATTTLSAKPDQLNSKSEAFLPNAEYVDKPVLNNLGTRTNSTTSDSVVKSSNSSVAAAVESVDCNEERNAVVYNSLAHLDDLISSSMALKKEGLPKRLICTICDARFCHLKSLQNHMSAQHNPKKGSLEYYTSLFLFVCDVCKDSFSTKQSLSEHMKTCHNKEYDSFAEFPCLTCDASFNTFSELKGHMIDKKHEFEWFCFTCQQKFPEESALRIHFCSKTADGTGRIVRPMFLCSICSKTFCGQKVFEKHLSHCTFSEYCARCAKHCHALKDVLEHTKDCGRGTTSYFCSSCDLFTRSITEATRLEKTKILLKRVHCRCCGKCFTEINTEFIQHEAKCEVNNRCEPITASSVLLQPSNKSSWADKCSSCYTLKMTMNSVNNFEKRQILLSRVHCTFCGKCFVENCPKFVAHENRCKWVEKCLSCNADKVQFTFGNHVDKTKVFSNRMHCKFCGICFSKKSTEFFDHEINCKTEGMNDQLDKLSTFLPPPAASWKGKCKSCQVFKLTITEANKLERTKVLMKRVHCKFCGKCFNEQSLDFFRHESKCKAGGPVRLLPSVEHTPKDTMMLNCNLVPVIKSINPLENIRSTQDTNVAKVNRSICSNPLNINKSSVDGSMPLSASVDANNSLEGGNNVLPVKSSFNNLVPINSEVSQTFAPALSSNSVNLSPSNSLTTGQVSQSPVQTLPKNTNQIQPCSLVVSQNPQPSPETQFLLITNADGSQILLPLANLTRQVTSSLTNVSIEPTTLMSVPKAKQNATVANEHTNLTTAPVSPVETLPVLAIPKLPSPAKDNLLEISNKGNVNNKPASMKKQTAVTKLNNKNPKQKALRETHTEILKNPEDKGGKSSSSYKRLKEKYVEERRAKRLSVSANLRSVWRCALCTITAVPALGETCNRCKTLYRLARSEQYKKTKTQESLWFTCSSCSVGCVPVQGGICGTCMKKLVNVYPSEIPYTVQTKERQVLVSDVPQAENMKFKTFLSLAINEALTEDEDYNCDTVSDRKFQWCSKCGHCFVRAQFSHHPCKSLRRHMQSCYVVLDHFDKKIMLAHDGKSNTTQFNNVNVNSAASFEYNQFLNATHMKYSESNHMKNQSQRNQTSTSSVQQIEFLPFVTEIPASKIRRSTSDALGDLEELKQLSKRKCNTSFNNKAKVVVNNLSPLPPQSPEFTQFVNKLTSEVLKTEKLSKNKIPSVTGSRKLDQFIGDLPEIVPTHYCAECNSAFDSEKLYTWHLRTHDEYRPFPCSHCGCRFRRLSNLHEHIRFYHLRGQVPCYKCGKRFANSLLLRKHNKLHTTHYQFKRRIVDPLRPAFELKKWKKSIKAAPPQMPIEEVNGYSPTIPQTEADQFMWPSQQDDCATSRIDEQSSVQDTAGNPEIISVQPDVESVYNMRCSTDMEQSDNQDQTSTNLEDSSFPNEDSRSAEDRGEMDVDIVEEIIET